MAEVYLAHDEVLDRDVALKVLREQYARNEEFVKRFRREAKSAASLIHPNIVLVYDWGRSEDGTYSIVMEYLPGGSLKDRILGNGALDPHAVTELGSQVARALGHAHERGVIHRDIKPRNILFTETGYPKVTDFGIAKAAAATTSTSKSGPILGTAGYMSPEQAMGKPVDPRTDLYSLGVVFYEMLTGTLPYRGEDPVSIASKHVDEPPPSLRDANPDIPEPLDALTTRLLAKDPEDRYASAFELAEDLERIRADLSPLAGSTAKTIEGAQTTAEMVTAPLPSTTKEPPEKTAILPPVASLVEVPKSSRRGGGWLFASWRRCSSQ
jgi:serine/threonine-protein kinase